MKPSHDLDSQKVDPYSSHRGIWLDYGYGEEVNFLILLGVASAMLSHRISNATGILGMQVNWLRKYISRDNKAALDLITSMRETVGTLSELSRAVEALRPDEPPPLDVNSLLYDAWEATSASYTSKTVVVSLNLPEDVPPVRAHSPLLAEVFRTVLENSFEAIDETDRDTGHISICSRHARESDVVEIEIEDDGVGIPRDILSKLFQCPVRSSKLSKGIGLWLARLMITRIGGEISTQYTEIGQGTTMRVTLPAIKTADTPTDGNHD